ncbi:lysozyme [Erythrobacter alti]|uniref:lysozyme n=1 Tax=Erythrobacter alti TaxID=1896145 RepID=UPI0030F46BD0
MDRKPLFDTLRRIIGRPFRQSEVDSIDTALDRQSGEFETVDDHAEDTAPTNGGGFKPRKIGHEGVDIIQRFEGCEKKRPDGLIEAYPDPGTGGDPWTIGWGATGLDHFNSGRIARGTIWTQEQCDARLEADLVRYAKDVDRALGDAPTTQAQFDALVSFHYNTGTIGKATLTRKHKAGDFAGAAREFDRWCYAGGRVLKGLVRRRAAESALYRK